MPTASSPTAATLLLTHSENRSNIDAYRAFFGTPLTVGSANRIIFAAADAGHAFLTENASMWEFFESGLAERLADLDVEAATVERVRRALREMLPAGESAIETAAQRLGLTRRTLQRKLEAESASYQAVLATTRRELADYYLANSAVSLAEIAYLLGFQDGNSFNRAFRAWTGQTPGEYRASRIKPRTEPAPTPHRRPRRSRQPSAAASG